jgi:Fe-S cluster biogenesis protein NfuA
MRESIEHVISDIVRPLVAADGGDVHLLDVTADRVIVALSGNCAGCPGRPYTTSGVIEPALRKVLGASVAIEVRAMHEPP